MKQKINPDAQTTGRKDYQAGSDMASMPSDASDGLIVLDNSLRILSFNRAATEILGPDLRHWKTISLEDHITGNYLKAVEHAVQKALSQGDAQIDLKAEIKTGESRGLPVLCSTHPLYATRESIMGVVLSIKVMVSPKEAGSPTSLNTILDLEQRSLLEALPEGVFTINTKWRIASFNRTAEEITGYARKDVLGRYCWEVFHSDLCDLGCPLKSALATGKTAMDQDIRILKKGGGRQTVLVNVGVLRDAKGLIIGAVETFRRLTGETESPDASKKNNPFATIVGKSKPIRHLKSILPDVAASEANVFITGESGTGKELFARAIHDNSSRARNPFMAVNCSAFAETLMESELFGHEKSAFTGAFKSKPGRFELAKRGTLFLDEIAELKPSLQIKLLRVLEQREFERVGGTTTISLEARIISATNRNLTRALRSGSFREDLYYRLRTVPLVIQPLRERKDDLPMLVSHFIKCFNVTFKKRVRRVAPEVMEHFMAYHWPGNVRELERTIEHAFVFVKGPVILPENLPQMEVFVESHKPAGALFRKAGKPDKEDVLQALGQTNGQKNKAARLLGISRTSLWRKMKSFDLLD